MWSRTPGRRQSGFHALAVLYLTLRTANAKSGSADPSKMLKNIVPERLLTSNLGKGCWRRISMSEALPSSEFYRRMVRELGRQKSCCSLFMITTWNWLNVRNERMRAGCNLREFEVWHPAAMILRATSDLNASWARRKCAFILPAVPTATRTRAPVNAQFEVCQGSLDRSRPVPFSNDSNVNFCGHFSLLEGGVIRRTLHGRQDAKQYARCAGARQEDM